MWSRIVLFSLIVAPLIPHLFNLTTDLVWVGQTAFLIMGLNIALLLLGGVLNSVIYSYQRVDTLKVFSIVQVVANALLTVLFLHQGFGLIGVVSANSLSVLGLMLLYWLFLRRNHHELTIDPRLINWTTFKEIAPFSLRVFVLGLTAQIL